MSYTLPEEFKNLYNVYTGDHSDQSTTIGNYLTKAISSSASDGLGHLIIVNNSHVMVYDNKNQLVTACDYRASLTNGFYEMTAVSHVGPALMSLVLLEIYGSDVVTDKLNELKTALESVRSFNATSLDGGKHWLQELNQEAWAPWTSEIRNMVNYACTSATSYIDQVLSGDLELNFDTMQSHLFQGNDNTGGIGYNNVMVSTFVLSALSGVYSIYQHLKDITAEEWQSAGVLIQSFPGELVNVYLNEEGVAVGVDDEHNTGNGSRRYLYGNLTAGLTKFTNWFYPTLQVLSMRDSNPASPFLYNLREDRIFFVPWVTMLDTSNGVPQSLPAYDFGYYRYTAWNGLYFRGKVSADAMASYDFPTDTFRVLKWGFANSDGVEYGKDGLWPGDYGFGSVDDLMKRVKHSFADVTEMLSNSVGFWVAPAFAANGFKVAGMTIPGLSGVAYPDTDA